jgi:hypothetical protein
VTKAEIQRGKIRHRLEIYWHETASRTPEGRSAYFPMTGSESGKSGVVPEGAVIRIRPTLNLKRLSLSPAAYVIARALQKYGAVVGDNSGQGNSLKLQGNTNWGGILNRNSLAKITCSSRAATAPDEPPPQEGSGQAGPEPSVCRHNGAHG